MGSVSQNGADGLPGTDGQPGHEAIGEAKPRDFCIECPTGQIGPRGQPGEKGTPGEPGQPGLEADGGTRGQTGNPGPPGPPVTFSYLIMIFITDFRGPRAFQDEKEYQVFMDVLSFSAKYICSGKPGLQIEEHGAGGQTGPVGVKGKTGEKGTPGVIGHSGQPGPKGPPGTIYL
uniref:Collagen triple helix repeat protein n=1 Tax=Meloidogyne hapla TaxID=6305 RepID=A0A1I8BXX7_MELHA